MTIGDKIRDEKVSYDINREAIKISALSSGKIDEYEYYTGEQIWSLPFDQSRMAELVNFTYFPLRKTLEKQTKTIEDQGRKQVEALKFLRLDAQHLIIKDTIPQDQLNEEAKNEKMRKWKKGVFLKQINIYKIFENFKQ